MVSQKALDSYGFESQDEYFAYVIESINNGQIRQGWGLLYSQDKKTRQEFFEYAKEHMTTDELLDLLIKLI